MGEIQIITFRKKSRAVDFKEETYWEIGVTRDDTYQERIEDQIDEIKTELDTIIAFAETIKTDEEKKAEETEKKLEETITIINESTTDEQKIELIGIYPEWEPNKNATEGSYWRYQEKLYKVNQGQEHTTQLGWEPDVAVSLFSEVVPPGTIGPWIQPTGQHDAYKIGDKVTHTGKLWECTQGDRVGNNTWEPGVYGWEEIIQ